MSYGGWRPYVRAATRRAAVARSMARLRGKGMAIEPVEIRGRKIARTFWGEAWCTHLEGFSDFANRLPRGRTYVRNGSVCHLSVRTGRIDAVVAGSELYKVAVQVAPQPARRWKNIRRQCAGRIGSLLELLQGRFSGHVMKIVTEPVEGLFPAPSAIEFHCDCPDWAVMCKHVAAVLYGVGVRLDSKPELLFVLRQVDHEALVSAELDMRIATAGEGKRRRLANHSLSDVFGIDIDDATPPAKRRVSPSAKKGRRSNNRKAVDRAPASRTASGAKSSVKKKPFSPTAASVARLRKRFGMTRRQFADLIGVCPATVANWENTRGKLTLRARTLAALTRVSRRNRP